MNILIIAHYQNDGSPSAIFIHEQAKAYAALGYTVRVIVPIALGKCGYRGKNRLSAVSEIIDGIPHYFVRYFSLSRFGAGGFNTRSAISALKLHFFAALDGFAPDVIHAHTLGFDSEVGAWLKTKLGCPLVVTTHGSDSTIPMEQGRSAEMKRLCDACDRVVAVSSRLKDRLSPCGTKTPISVILNGFALSAMPEPSEKEPCSVIQVGNLLEQKRTHITMQAFAKLHASHPEAVFTIVGQGPERETLEALSRELGIARSVRFLGQLPNKDVLNEMSRAQFFCMPSVREGFGIVYLEAMACGCITIGTEGEGIADLIENGKNGFLVPPDDPDAIVRVIEWCLAHPAEADVIAQRGRQDALHLTWEKNAAEYIALFQSLIQ